MLKLVALQKTPSVLLAEMRTEQEICTCSYASPAMHIFRGCFNSGPKSTVIFQINQKMKTVRTWKINYCVEAHKRQISSGG